ncbi:hypothetical protein HanPI659440_Chr03g0115311 [Helianthus annuus]|nr:hypothetical protein HanPI659440_Chr03g0115311 [Helianthus annuus]
MPIYQAHISSLFSFEIKPSFSEFSGNHFFLLHDSLCSFLSMATRIRSQTGESTLTFVNQNLLKNPEKEICSFDNADNAALRASGAFSDKAVIRPFDRTLWSDVSSSEWICFPAYPFSLGLRYPFPEFMMQFFHKTGLSFFQMMPMVWRVLIVFNQIKALHIPDLPIAYRLRSHGSSRFLLFSTSNNPLILKVTKKMRTDGNVNFSLLGETPSLRVIAFR